MDRFVQLPGPFLVPQTPKEAEIFPCPLDDQRKTNYAA